MFNLPKPKLGEVTAFTISSPELEISSRYYQKLGFTELFRSDFPYPVIQISDGAIQIMLREHKDPYIALTYYVKDIGKIARQLETEGISFVQKPEKTDQVKKYLIQTPDGFYISLVSGGEGFVQPQGPVMLTMPQEDYFNPEKYPNKVCGLFGELAYPVNDLSRSISYWEKLGFKVLSRFESPYSWAIISDGISVVGLHQTRHFSSPAITYFAADMKDKIQNLISQGLPDYIETGAGNIVLTTPEKQNINLFKLGT